MQVITVQTINPGETPGGLRVMYMELVQEFLHKGWDVHHISPRGLGEIKQENFTHHSVFSIPVGLSSVPFLIQAAFKMLRIGINEKIDAIVVFSQLEAIPGLVFKLFHRDTKLVVSFNCDTVSAFRLSDTKPIRKSLSIAVIKNVDKLALKKADLLIFVSKGTKTAITERARYDPASKTKIIYNAVTPRLTDLSKAKSVRVAKGKRTVGYVGILNAEEKGLSYLIKAFRIVKQELTDVALVVVGDGRDREVLAELAENLSLRDNVIFTGYQKNPLQYMKGFDLLVLPSTHEAFGSVLLEAISVGTPAIGSNVGGIPEILEYDELLFEPRDVDGLATKIQTLLSDDEAYNKARVLCALRNKAFAFNWANAMSKSIEELVKKPL